ncbi:MAG: uroporphyrinogen decarboxylase family protein, partial [Armatimonadota bacterium]|nr:uroporphyrinogen decarboxylase family protein [Armatimonadota bacterium]
MGTLTPRERVRAALSHEEPDRVPMDLGATYASGIIQGAYQRLCAYLGLSPPMHAPAGRSATASIDEEVLRRLQVDCRGITPNTPDLWTTHNADGTQTDGWGVTWGRPPGGHFYVVKPPLAGEPALADVERLPIPDPDDPQITDGLQESVSRLRAAGDYAICLNLPSRLVHQIEFQRGYAEALVDLVSNPTLAEALMERITEFNVRAACRVLDLIGNEVDVVCIGDDLGTQNGPFVNPRTYRALIKPRQRRLTEAIRRRTNAFLFYHSCGSVVDLIPDLIDLGVQVLNPVQVSAAGMDPERLKREFGKHLAFWGAVDTHRVLPRGTPSEVEDKVRQLLDR